MAILIISTGKVDPEIYNSIPVNKESVMECIPCEAKDLVNRCHFDLALLDCREEVKNGMELLKELKMTYPRMPVIFITDISSNDIVLEAFKTGVLDFFKRPLKVSEIRERIKGILVIKRVSKEIRKPFKGIVSRRISLPENTTRFRNLSETLRYIEKNLSAKITLDNIAEQAHISKSYFYKLFKKQTGQSFSKFVTAMRIEKAKELFRRNDLSISMAAIDVGFNDNIIFARHFRKITGMTPSTFKRSLKVNHIAG